MLKFLGKCLGWAVLIAFIIALLDVGLGLLGRHGFARWILERVIFPVIDKTIGILLLPFERILLIHAPPQITTVVGGILLAAGVYLAYKAVTK